jgi:hypothetical protein
MNMNKEEINYIISRSNQWDKKFERFSYLLKKDLLSMYRLTKEEGEEFITLRADIEKIIEAYDNNWGI